MMAGDKTDWNLKRNVRLYMWIMMAGVLVTNDQIQLPCLFGVIKAITQPEAL